MTGGEYTTGIYVNTRIQILPEHLSNKIAAGEVIQRPESVVKELLENSFDAGSKSITIVIEEGGKRLIRVSDDGEGISNQDALLAFQRHATSKISSAGDLEAIRTFGFRGEALPSIAAVAQVTLKTRTSEDDAATVVQIAGAGKPDVSAEARERGTTVIVQNLFYNVPARRKFLKSDTTEFRHIYDVVQRLALSQPEVSLRFLSDQETILDLKPGTKEQRVRDALGTRQFEGMIPIDEQGDILSITGYIGKPSFSRKTRANQYLFLNRRYIVNRSINHAVFAAYEHLLLKNSFPFFLLFLEIDPHRVDVNVHPSKLEAKFEDEQAIHRFVHNLVRKTLSVTDSVPAISAHATERGGEVGLRFTEGQHSWPEKSENTAPDLRYSPFGSEHAFSTVSRGGFSHTDGKEIASRLLGENQDVQGGSFGEQGSAQETAIETRPAQVWQIHNKYILLQIGSGVMIIDQHAAHERVLYERVLERFTTDSHSAQQVLFPQTIELNPGDSMLVREILHHFEEIGFSIKPFGGNTFVIEGVPTEVKEGDGRKVFEEMLALYKESAIHSPLEQRDALAKSFSCRAAIKAGDRLTEQETRSLVDQLFATKMPYVCPHGRPVLMRISLDELDRRFGRK